MKKKVFRERYNEILFVSRDVDGNIQDIKTFAEIKDKLKEEETPNATNVKVSKPTKKKVEKKWER